MSKNPAASLLQAGALCFEFAGASTFIVSECASQEMRLCCDCLRLCMAIKLVCVCSLHLYCLYFARSCPLEALSTFWLGIMALPSSCSLCAFALLLGLCCGADVRVVDSAGGLSNAGLLQVKTDTGYGSVCGANAASAEVTRRKHIPSLFAHLEKWP